MPSYGGDLVVPDITLHELLWEKLPKYGNDIAIIDSSQDGRSLTYMDVYNLSRKCAAYLQSIGIKKGDFISICAFGSLESAYLMIGILGCGAVVTPCNPSYRKAEILHEFNISCPRVVFVEEEMVDMMKSVKREVSFIEKLIVIGDSKDLMTLHEILRDPNIEPLREVDVDPRNDTSFAPRSSGTTGLPKCLLLSHRSYIAYYTMDLTEYEMSKTRDTSHAMYNDRPLYHGSGYVYLLRNLIYGLRTITARSFQLDEMFRIIEKYQATSALCVPPVLIEMANATNNDKYDLTSLKLITTAGASHSPHIVQSVMKQYRVSLSAMYAMSEAPMVTYYDIPVGEKSNSCGRPVKGVELKITDIVTEDECLTGCDGEIRIRTPQIMKGYYKNDAANSAAFDQEGWYKTGDIGHLDEDGNVYITGRLKEIIQYRINQVSPAQLESVIIRHTKVADVGVVGIPHEIDGEHPKALVVPYDKSLTTEEVHSIVNENLAEYKHLRGGVQFVASIPKSKTGKILRKELKKMAGF